MTDEQTIIVRREIIINDGHVKDRLADKIAEVIAEEMAEDWKPWEGHRNE
jgi:hypothetical protein